MPKVVAVVDYLGVRNDPDCYKEFKIGSQTHKRYSSKAIEKTKEALRTVAIDEIWQNRKLKAKEGAA